MEDDDDGGMDDLAAGDDAAPPPEGDMLTRDVEEAVASQLAEKGDPDAYDGLKGRDDSYPGGRYEGLEEYAATAKANGTSIQAAVKDYATAEQILRKDPAAGIEHILQRMGHDPRAVNAQMYHRYNGAYANQHSQALARQQLHSQYQAQVSQFEKNPANKHFASLRQDMAQLVQARKASTIQQAYKMALAARPQLGIQDRLDRELSRKDKQYRKRK